MAQNRVRQSHPIAVKWPAFNVKTFKIVLENPSESSERFKLMRVQKTPESKEMHKNQYFFSTPATTAKQI